MREKNVESFDFLTKTYVDGKSNYPKARVILKAISVALSFLMLIVISNGELSFKAIGPYIVLLTPMIIMLVVTKPFSGYTDVPVKVEVYTNKIIMIYDEINKGDKLGGRREKISIKYSDIKKLQYSNALRCLNIEGMPLHIIRPLNMPNSKEIISDF